MAAACVAQRCRTFGNFTCGSSSCCSSAAASGRGSSLPSPLVVRLDRRSSKLCCGSDGRGACWWYPQAIPRPPLYSVSASARESVNPPSQSHSSTAEKSAVKTDFKHALLPIVDRNPYLSESTRQAAATATALAKKNNANITVLVIDQGTSEKATTQDGKDNHELQLQNIRWHLSEGGFEDYTLVDKLGVGQTPAALIGELADDLGLDLVIMDMGAIHQKHVDANLLAEFVPCPVLMLPL